MLVSFSLYTFIILLRSHTHLVKMFRGNVYSAVEPANRPSVKADAVEYFFVAQRGKELVLLNERQTIEDALTAVIERQVKPVAVKRAGGNDPFQFVLYFHTLIQWQIMVGQIHRNDDSVEMANLWHILSFVVSWRQSYKIFLINLSFYLYLLYIIRRNRQFLPLWLLALRWGSGEQARSPPFPLLAAKPSGPISHQDSILTFLLYETPDSLNSFG